MPWQIGFVRDVDKPDVGMATAEWVNEAGEIVFSHSERVRVDAKEAAGFRDRAAAARAKSNATAAEERALVRALRKAFREGKEALTADGDD